MKQESPQTGQSRLVPTAYKIVGCSFIPLLGVLFGIVLGCCSRAIPQIGIFLGNFFPFILIMALPGAFLGLVAIVLGILRRKQDGWKLMALGCLGILVNGLIIEASIYIIGQAIRAGDRSPVARMEERNLAKRIEFYKTTHGHYPESLADVEKAAMPPEDRFPTPASSPRPSPSPPSSPNYLYYQLVPDHQHYYLFWVGPDGKPFTADDENPLFSNAELKNMGLKMRGWF